MAIDPMAEPSPGPDFSVHADKLMRVVCGIRRKDIGDCLSPDVNHAADVLVWAANIETLHPGALTEVLDDLLPLVLGRINRESALSAGYVMASAYDAGAEFEAIHGADQHGDRDTALLARCEFLRKINGWTRAEAIRWMAEVSGKTFGAIDQALKRGKAANKPGK